MSLELWLAFAAASTALLLVPGPTVSQVLSCSLTKGRPVALASAAGMALGVLAAMSASLMSLSAIVMASAAAFTVLKRAGAIYLVWLGLKLIHSASSVGLVPMRDATAKDVFRHAATVTALNSKSIAFFIAFMTQFVSVDAPLLHQFAILIATFVNLAVLNALANAILADRMRRFITRPGLSTGITSAGGETLIRMGVLTATLRRKHQVGKTI